MTAAPAPSPSSAWRRTALVVALVLLLHAAVLVGLPLRLPQLPAPAPAVVTQARILAPPPPPAPPAPPARPAPPVSPPPAARTPPAAHADPPRPPVRRAAPPARHPAAPAPAPTLAPAPAPVAPPISLVPDPVVVDPSPAAAERPAAQAPPAAAAAGSAGGQASSAGAGSEGASAPAGGASPIHPSVRLDFEMQGQRGVQPWKGVFGRLDWRQDGQRYQASLAIKVLFKTVRSQSSSGRIVNGALAPERFSETRRRTEEARLDRGQGRVVFGNGAPAAALQAGAQDRLSVVMQLGALLAAGEAAHPAGSRITIQTVGPKDAEMWTFEVGQREEVSVPAGRYAARHLLREPRHADDYRLELWLAPELGYLPVRMRQTQPDGDVIDLQLRDASAP